MEGMGEWKQGVGLISWRLQVHLRCTTFGTPQEAGRKSVESTGTERWVLSVHFHENKIALLIFVVLMCGNDVRNLRRVTIHFKVQQSEREEASVFKTCLERWFVDIQRWQSCTEQLRILSTHFGFRCCGAWLIFAALWSSSRSLRRRRSAGFLLQDNNT